MTTFSMKQRTKIGTWNIRTLNEAPTKLEQICGEFHRRKISILGLCEMRWLDNGERTIYRKIDDEDVRLSLIFSGKPTIPGVTVTHESGVGLLLSSAAKRSLMEWTPVSDRILVARFRSKARNVSIVHVYAPTNTSPVDVKDDFYSLLSSTLNNVRRGDILIVMGDLNAKVGEDNSGYELFMGREGVANSRRNDNGDRFVEFCATNQLVIGGTLFKNKEIYKLTWKSNDGYTKSQLDHFTISRRWRRSLLNTRVYRGPDVHTDHWLLVSTIQLKLASVKQKFTNLTRKIDPSKLRFAEKKRHFISDLKRNLSSSPAQDSNQRWVKVRNALQKAGENTIMKEPERRKCYISDATWKLIMERKALFDRLNEAERGRQYLKRNRIYNECHLRVKYSARRDHRRWLNERADEAQHAANQHRMRDTYRITKQLCHQGNHSEVPCKDKDGKPITNVDSQISRWTEHFQSVLNAQSQPSTCRFHYGALIPEPAMPINTKSPSVTEIKNAIKNLKNWKAPGPDGLAAELFKADVDLIASELRPIIAEAWDKCEFPSDWKAALVIKLQKKGDPSICGNWRGIVLQNTVMKLLAQILLERIRPALEPSLRDEQAGFRKGRSCTDHVNTLRIIIEQSRVMQASAYLLFVDFEKAFDSIRRDKMWEILKEYGVPASIINIITNLYLESNLRIVHQGKLGPKFGVMTGVKQGDILSPFLFLIVLDYVLRNVADKPRGIQWMPFKRLEDLDYADDIVFLAQRHQDMKEIIERLVAFAKDVGLKINVPKTKVMLINPRVNTRATSDPFMIDGQILEQVEKFQYLGSIVTPDGGADEDVENRIRCANAAFSNLRSLWHSHRISLNLKLRIFNSNVKSVLLYGSETWKVTTAVTQKLQVFVNRKLRIICGIFYPRVISNEILLQMCNQSPMVVEIGRRKWRWIGHTLRKASDDIARQAMSWNPPGKRKVGGQIVTWQSSVRREAADLGKEWKEAAELAQNRVRWSRFVEALRFLKGK